MEGGTQRKITFSGVITVPISRFILPPAFLHGAQSRLDKRSSAEDIERANQEALEAAIAASQLADESPQQLTAAQEESLTALQKFAFETGDPDTIRYANDAALAQGIHASLDEETHGPRRPRATVPANELRIQHHLVAQLKQQLRNQGFDIKPNNGRMNNCLIISMLQHVTGNYDSNHEAAAKKYKMLLCDWSNGKEKFTSPLYSDDVLTELLIDRINYDHFGDQQDRYLRFAMVSPDQDGEAAVREIGKGQRIAGIIDGSGHYEAYVKR